MNMLSTAGVFFMSAVGAYPGLELGDFFFPRQSSGR